MRKLFFLIFILLSVAFESMAQLRNASVNDFVGMSDLIIVGTIDKVIPPGESHGSATIHVDRILKGKKILSLEIINLISMTNYKVLEERSQKLLFLQQTRDGYVTIAGSSGIKETSEEKLYLELIKNFPIEIYIDKISNPIQIGLENKITAIIKNSSDSKIGISSINAEGYLYSPLMEMSLSNIIRLPNAFPHISNDSITIIEPKSEYRVVLSFDCNKPASWINYDKMTYFLSIAAIRIRVSVNSNLSKDTKFDYYYVVSPLIDIMLGFPIPESVNLTKTNRNENINDK